jgi:hypothetical protein
MAAPGFGAGRAQEAGGPARSPGWQTEQAARFGVALEIAVSALWQAGAVLHAWEQVQFGGEYEPPRQLVRQLQDLGRRLPVHPVSAPAYTDDESFEVRYRDYLLQRWGLLDVGTLRAVSSVTVTLGDLFVMPRVAREEIPPRRADEAVFDNAARLTVLIGPPGSGKSTLLLWVQQQVAGCARELILGDGQALPVLIRVRELQDLSPQDAPQGRRLVELATGSRDIAVLMPEGRVERQFASGRVLLLLDGLDETEPSTRDGMPLPWVASLLKTHPTWRVVATSRPAGFPKSAFAPPEGEPSEGEPSEGTFSLWHPVLYTLEEFGPEEAGAYLRSWCTQVRIASNESAAEAARRGREDAAKIARSVDRHPAVKELARTPLLLSAICLVYRFEGGKLPDDRATLYRLCVEGLLDRWDAQKGLRSPFRLEEKLWVCRELAAWMMSADRAACTYPEARSIAGFSGGASLVLADGTQTVTVTKPDVVAPGAQVWSCVPPGPVEGGPHSYAFMDGTSMATPHVSGAVALLMAACPTAPAPAIIEAVRKTARHPDPARSPDNRWGCGLVQLQAAHEWLRDNYLSGN